MPGNRVAMLGAHHDHVAPVAIGDDLILKVLGRITAASEGIELRSQSRPLASKPFADVFQRGTGGIGDVTGRLDRATDRTDLCGERRHAVADRRQPAAGAVDVRSAQAGCDLIQRFQKASEGQQRKRIERLMFDLQRGEHRLKVVRRPKAQRAAIPHECQCLSGPIEIGLNLGPVHCRLEFQCARAAKRRQRFAGQGLANPVELQRAESGQLHGSAPSDAEQTRIMTCRSSAPRPRAPAQSRRAALRFSSSSSDFGQSPRSRRESDRSASSTPPVWHVGQ